MRMKGVSILIIAVVALASVAMGYPEVCIDPGHGGSDAGAVGYVTEKYINLETSLDMRDWLNLDTDDGSGGYAWSVIMTRSTDVYVSLSDRVAYANNNDADRFFSIHANAFSDESANGSETFCYTYGSSSSFDLRNKTQEELIAHGGLYDRGTKTAGFYVLKYTNMPAILTELGFVTNYDDSQKLGSSSWRNEVAKGFLHALQRHYGYSAYTPSAHVTRIVDNADSGFSASGDWWVGSWSSQKYGDDYHVRSTEAVTDPATWSVSLPSSAYYDVYAWWTDGSNRASSAPYIVYYSGDSEVVKVDQTVNGGKWNLLGTYYMYSGSNQVKLSCWTSSGDYVIADAIKWYK